MALLTKKTPHRAHINTDDPREVNTGRMNLGLVKRSFAVIEKVGNAAAAVRKRACV
jgi:hypothetical protein